MNRQSIDWLVGLFVVMGIAALIFLSFKVANIASLGNEDGYQVYANFENIGKLKPKAPVMVAGVRVGEVRAIELDEEMFQATVMIHINDRYRKFPLDTSASILTSGLLGEQYISLEPGGEDEFLEEGSEIELTQPAFVLEKMIGQLLFNANKDSE